MATVTATNIATAAEPGRRTRARSRRGRLVARAAIVGVIAAAGAVLLPHSLSAALTDSRPDLAARIAPWSAQAAVEAAAAIAHDPRDPQVRALVTRALARDASLVSAIELRAADLAASGKPTEARQLFALSNRLSRRSLPTRLWLIQQSVDRGDVAGALDNFDIALRTSTEAPPILFPVLARASSDPTLTAPIARMLDRPSDWRLMYFEWALTNDADLGSLANVAIAMNDRGVVREGQIDQRLIAQLATAGDFAQAVRLRNRFDPPSPGLIADPHFANPKAQFPFGWGLASDGTMGAERGLGTGGAQLSYQAGPAHSGQVAAQLLVLAPGRYSLSVKSAAAGVGEAPYWSVACGQAGGSEIAGLDQPLAAGRLARTEFAVPAGCPAQWLTLSIRPSAESTPQTGAVQWVAVTKL